MCFGYSKEPSHGDGSFEYPQHMFWLRNKKYDFQLRILISGPAWLLGALSLKCLCTPVSGIVITKHHKELKSHAFYFRYTLH